MSKIKFMANWSKGWQKEFNIPKGFILLRYKPLYRKNLAKILLKLDEYQQKRLNKLSESNELFNEEDWIRDIEIDLEYYYQKRSLNQNALMWSLYTIEANEMNGGEKGHKDQMVTADELYRGDLYENGERETIITRRKYLGSYTEEYKMFEIIVHNENTYRDINEFLKVHANDDDEITIKVIRGSSKFNTMEMYNWITMIFNRLTYNGVQVTNPGEIQNYWHKWREYLNDNQFEFSDVILTQQEYKQLNPICEGCGDQIIDRGELAHIQAVGMGNDRSKEPKRNYSSNWLHLCTECHRGIQHQKGWKEFLKQYRHLTYKVNKALNRDYEPIKEPLDKNTIDTPLELNKRTHGNPEKIEDKIEHIKQLAIKQEAENIEKDLELFNNVYSEPVENMTDDDIKEARVKFETIQQVVDGYNNKELTQSDACIKIDRLGGDPKIIDPAWVEIY